MSVVSRMQLLTPAETCQILGISRFQLYHLSAQGKLRKVKVGQRLRFRPQDVEAYIDANTIEPLAQDILV